MLGKVIFNNVVMVGHYENAVKKSNHTGEHCAPAIEPVHDVSDAMLAVVMILNL